MAAILKDIMANVIYAMFSTRERPYLLSLNHCQDDCDQPKEQPGLECSVGIFSWHTRIREGMCVAVKAFLLENAEPL